MGAIVVVREKNLASQAATNKGYINITPLPIMFKLEDSGSTDGCAPIIIPGSVQRSYEVWLRLSTGVVGPSTSITSPVFYSDGNNGFGSGVSLYARTTNPGAYSTPTIPADDSAGTSVFTYTSASPKALDVANTGPFSGTNTDFGDYLVLWLTITNAAISQGKATEFRLPLESLFFSWSET